MGILWVSATTIHDEPASDDDSTDEGTEEEIVDPNTYIYS